MINMMSAVTTRQAQHSKTKGTAMKTKHGIVIAVSLSVGLALILSFANGCATSTSTGDQMKPMTSAEHQQMLSK